MDEAEIQLREVLQVAKDALARYENSPTPPNFRMWRDSSELAVKWYRQWRLGGGNDEDSFDEGLAKVLAAGK